jgi:hypothetical protein
MSNIRLIGLESIRIGDVGVTGAMGTTLTSMVATVPDSAHLILEAPGTTDLYVEEEDLPDISILGTAKKSLEFATRDIGGAVLLEAFGGSYITTTGVWSAPVTAVVIKESCIEAISKTYNGKKLKIEIPRASIKTGGDLRFTKTESGQITFSCDVKVPASSTQISPLVITQV